ncbi:MAG: hypothetical protein KF859_08895 [Phycisphaeraceae bacterium]|nr:hypothetical protein [Phycisphaeraceae bacterium]
MDADGRRVTNLRPDVQVYDPKEKKWIIVEVGDKSTYGIDKQKDRNAQMASALGVPESQVKMIYHDRGRGATIQTGRKGRPGNKR